MPSKVFWNSTPILLAVPRAFRKAALDTKMVALAMSPSKIKAGARIEFTGAQSALLKGTGLANIFEKGAKRHPIEPKKKQAMKTKDGRFFRGKIDHPGSDPKPYINPASKFFPTLFFKSAAGAFRGILR